MTPDPGHGVTDDREVIESNVRRVVGIAALRRIHKTISDRREEERIMRTRVAPIAAAVMIAIAALIWAFGTVRPDGASAPLPECSPPRSDNITV